MEPTSTVQGVSFKKIPRNGQAQVLKYLEGKKQLNVQLPTGYGKTFTACAAYSVLKNKGAVNRLLFIVPTKAQLDQFVLGGHEDLKDASVTGSLSVTDVSFFKANALKKHREDKSQVYATTIQALISSGGMDRINALLTTGRWMIVIDEYHHYGVDKTWGNSIDALNYEFRLAMSATPHRPGDDSAFGKPDVVVEYRQAVDEKAVKPLTSHSYVYRVDAINPEGEVVSYTTSELSSEWGVDANDPNKLEKMRIERGMRWSPKYVSPLVCIPLDRMHVNCIISGYRLQAIIGAMCVSHAEMVCDQVKSMYPELSVDWVGTGPDGRTDEENADAIKRFCPPKVDGKRKPTLDVLVHVGMAGEGLDSTNVSEIIHLNPATINNSNNQENGRAARYLEGVVGNINFDSSSEYAKKGYIGAAIMDAMDFNSPSEDNAGEEHEEDASINDVPELPEEPKIFIADMEIITIHSEGVQMMAKAIAGAREFTEFTMQDFHRGDETLVTFAMDLLKKGRQKEAEEFDERSMVEQWKDHVGRSLRTVGSLVIRKSMDARPPKSLRGEINKKINTAKKSCLGPVTEDIEVLKKHYQWVRNLEQEILSGGIPSWLM